MTVAGRYRSRTNDNAEIPITIAERVPLGKEEALAFYKMLYKILGKK